VQFLPVLRIDICSFRAIAPGEEGQMRVSAVLACENQPIFYPPSNSYMMCSFRLSPASVYAVRQGWILGE